MKAVVVYESLWGNTAAIAEAIAEGIGGGARVVTTSEADEALVDGADLLVAGAPLLGFALPTERIRASIPGSTPDAPRPADVSHPSMRAWLAGRAPGTGRFASFETRIWWSPGSAAKAIATQLEALGYRSAARPAKFLVAGKYGPLKSGELERAKVWGAELARTIG